MVCAENYKKHEMQQISMQKIRFIEHTADIEFEAFGKSLEEAFENAALAMFEIMTNTKKVGSKIKKEIKIESEDLESLLYDFLEQFLIFHDSENLIFSKFKVRKISKNTKYKLEAEVWGEEFDPKKHESKTLVKAVTYHDLVIGKKENLDYVHVHVDI